MKTKLTFEDKGACAIVENYLRTLGKNVVLTIDPHVVEVSDASWAGGSTGKTLAEALEDALNHEN